LSAITGIPCDTGGKRRRRKKVFERVIQSKCSELRPLSATTIRRRKRAGGGGGGGGGGKFIQS
jgi:hypothetical protein